MKRTYLGCYYLVSAYVRFLALRVSPNSYRLSIMLKKPNALKSNSYIEACYEELPRLQERPEDIHLGSYIQLQKLADDICATFGYHSHFETTAFSPERIQLSARDFVARLQALRRSFPQATKYNSKRAMAWTMRAEPNQI